MEIHQRFYQAVPESLRQVPGVAGEAPERVVPGQWRLRNVEAGRHLPPEAADIPALMDRFCDAYQPSRFVGTQKIIAILAAHHRLLWIHPFLDGNGRVARLWTDAALKAAGLQSTGLWCLSRGLARRAEDYKVRLARADMPRQGEQDGRGALSESSLVELCDFLLDIALDQVDFMARTLTLSTLQRRMNAYIAARNDGRVPGINAATHAGIKPIAGLIVFNAFVQGELDRAQALALTGMPERSARRLLAQLRDEGLLSETSSRSPLRWEIPEHAEPWYFPELAPGIV